MIVVVVVVVVMKMDGTISRYTSPRSKSSSVTLAKNYVFKNPYMYTRYVVFKFTTSQSLTSCSDTEPHDNPKRLTLN